VTPPEKLITRGHESNVRNTRANFYSSKSINNPSWLDEPEIPAWSGIPDSRLRGPSHSGSADLV